MITGGSGMLGRYLLSKLDGSRYEVIAPDRSKLDLADCGKVYAFIKEANPHAVVHLGAETDVDLCERDPGHASRVNHLSTKSVARAARDSKAWLLYISTSNVFGIDSKPLSNEIDVPFPLNYYGRSKFFGEREIERLLPEDSLIIRAAWMIGGGPQHDHKFVGKMVEKMTGGANLVRAVGDRYGTLTSASALASFIEDALEERRCGLLHFASQGVVSRFDLAIEIARHLRFEGGVEPVASCAFPLSAPRPVFEGLESLYLSAMTEVRAWREDLASYLSEFHVST